MAQKDSVNMFFLQYGEQVYTHALQLREVLLAHLPNVTEQLDLSARMVAYCYGQKYAAMVCTIIPSKKGLKLGFYKGVDLPDPDQLLEGKGKISRYVEIISDKQIKSAAIKKLIKSAWVVYKQRMKDPKVKS